MFIEIPFLERLPPKAAVFFLPIRQTIPWQTPTRYFIVLEILLLLLLLLLLLYFYYLYYFYLLFFFLMLVQHLDFDYFCKKGSFVNVWMDSKYAFELSIFLYFSLSNSFLCANQATTFLLLRRCLYYCGVSRSYVDSEARDVGPALMRTFNSVRLIYSFDNLLLKWHYHIFTLDS